MRLLVVEDDERTAAYLQRALTEAGHVVDVAGDGPLGAAMAGEGIYDLLVIDRRLPGMDGIAVITKVRAGNAAIPILMLSAEASTSDRVEGIRAGSDDYLAKPYAVSELLARVEAVGRRRNAVRSTTRLQVATLVMDTGSRQLTRDGATVALQPREFLLLEYFMRHADEVVTRTMLLEAVWGYHFEPRGAVIETHVHRLRRKIGDDGCTLIQTLSGVGYVMRTSI